ncbi:hypothetical protein [Flexithrix dorotheae]|uniref:hypothetical protein n=1 Tax=Flexithrix dorotheae TaxID=70993 RepID=UPI0003A4C2AC|nr:hypothetical protein [Flexithrix dorotheae]
MPVRKNHKFLAILNVVGFLMVIIINALANILPINNKTTGELSDQYPNLFVPAGVTFSIWGLIYILLAGFVVFQLVSAFSSKYHDDFLSKISSWFLVSCLANSSWILAWHYEQVAISLTIMILLLFSLIQIYRSLHHKKKEKENLGKIFWTKVPFSIYLGWISIATIANVTALLVNINFTGFGISEPQWAQALILAGIILSLIMMFKRQDIFYGLVVIWAYFGIYLKQNNSSYEGIVVVAVFGILLIAIGIISQVIRKQLYFYR